MKFLLLLVVLLAAVAWFSIGRRRRDDRPAARREAPAERDPSTMIACMHCGLHLPQAEALFDAAGRPYCSEAHRLAGPR